MENTEQTPFAQAFAGCLAEASGRMTPQSLERRAAARARCDVLYRQLAEKAGFALADEFDAAKNCLTALVEEDVYEQGFRDCVYLLRWLGIF